VDPEIDALIRRADEADPVAADRLFALLYDELHRLAEQNLRRGGLSLTLGPTTLVHEAYLNVATRDGVAFVDRSRFLAYASRAMRGLVIDHARRRQAKKRGRQLEITLTDDAELHAGALVLAEELERKARLLLHRTLLEDDPGAPDAGP
jgi:RNA polymerase sigma factor (TIGR02999 family)